MYLKLIITVVVAASMMFPGALSSTCNNNTRIECYDCDTRYATNCNAGPFSNTTIITKTCSGCCSVMKYKPPQNYIIRTCINLQSPLTRQSSDSIMTTYCNENLCNVGSLEMAIKMPLLITFLAVAIVIDIKNL